VCVSFIGLGCISHICRLHAPSERRYIRRLVRVCSLSYANENPATAATIHEKAVLPRKPSNSCLMPSPMFFDCRSTSRPVPRAGGIAQMLAVGVGCTLHDTSGGSGDSLALLHLYCLLSGSGCDVDDLLHIIGVLTAVAVFWAPGGEVRARTQERKRRSWGRGDERGED
jgi:hypothetical protein